MTRLELIKQYVLSVFKLTDIELEIVSGDASFRQYFRVYINNKSYIVMDAPPDKESIIPFINISHFLKANNINVPNIYFESIHDGILILEDFGDDNYLEQLNHERVDTLYCQAIDSLISMQKSVIPKTLKHYDNEMLLSEMALFDNWLIEQYLNIDLNKQEKQQLNEIKNTLIENALNQKQVFVHRDYHSRNLMYVNSNNPGIIDYQDAVQGPISYDIVSLLKDCYIKWPMENVLQWLKYFYDNSHLKADISFDDLVYQFHLMGVQRHMKAAGIFCRLKIRDKKPGFINDIPRTLSYIMDLKDIENLQPLIDLIERKINPALKEKP